MNRNSKQFLTLLKCAVVLKCPLQFSEPADWSALLRIGAGHNLLPVVYEKASEDETAASDPQCQKWKIPALKLIGMQAMRTEYFLRLYQKFLDAGLHPVVVKGLIMRKLYGEFENHRPSGDEDVIVSKEEFTRVRQVLLDAGYVEEDRDVSEKQLANRQEISYKEPKSELLVEVHINPMGVDSALRRRMNRNLEDVFSHCTDENIDGVAVRTLLPTSHFLFLSMHTLRHFTAGGIGVRHLLDLMLYAKAYEDEIRWDDIRLKLRELKAETLFSDLIRIGNEYLGFELSPWLPECYPDELLSDILRSGTFGNISQVQRTAGNLTYATASNIGTETGINRTKALLRSIFPEKRAMLDRFPELTEKPWLLPVCWGKRWAGFLRHNRSEGGHLANESIQYANRRIELMRKYEML